MTDRSAGCDARGSISVTISMMRSAAVLAAAASAMLVALSIRWGARSAETLSRPAQSPRQSAELDGALAIRIPSLATALIALPLLGYSTGEQIETSALVSAAAAGVLIGLPTAALFRYGVLAARNAAILVPATYIGHPSLSHGCCSPAASMLRGWICWLSARLESPALISWHPAPRPDPRTPEPHSLEHGAQSRCGGSWQGDERTRRLGLIDALELHLTTLSRYCNGSCPRPSLAAVCHRRRRVA